MPIFDERVDKALKLGDSQWSFWQAVARDERLPQLLDVVRRLRSSVELLSGEGSLTHVSDLRLIDVVVWRKASLAEAAAT